MANVDTRPYRPQPVVRVVDDRLRPIVTEMDRVLQLASPILLGLPSASIGVAPANASYITIGNTADLTAERALTGTTNQIIVTDNGPDSSVVLSTPQDLDTAADFQVATLLAQPVADIATHAIIIADARNTTLYASNCFDCLDTNGLTVFQIVNNGTVQIGQNDVNMDAVLRLELAVASRVVAGSGSQEGYHAPMTSAVCSGMSKLTRAALRSKMVNFVRLQLIQKLHEAHGVAEILRNAETFARR